MVDGPSISRVDATLAGRVALVTGSSSGIGLGIAESLAKRGCDVILHGLCGADEARKCKAVIEGYKVKVHFEDHDLSDVVEVDKMADAILKAFPNGIDILVNNAGFQSVSDVISFSIDTWQKMLGVHLSAPFLLSKRFLPAMISRGWGRIVNVSSAHGLVASPYKSAYVSAKHGLIGLTKVVALETAGSGVTCNAICPGWVETPMFIKQVEAKSKEQNISFEEAKRQIVSSQPSQEPVKVEDIGELVAFTCSAASSQITGSCLVIDGGYTAR